MQAKSFFWNDPRVRAVIFQIAVLAVVIGFGLFIFNNTLENLDKRGITSGFSFLSSTSGFAIIQTLIDYSEESSYGEAFLVGLLNTLLISGLGIALATLLGFIIGIARLSSNWLVARLAAVYIEIFRNIPLLLQLFFWYFTALQFMPSPHQSFSIGTTVFLNIRGLYLPALLPQAGFWWIPGAFLAAIVISYLLVRWSRRQQDRTGNTLPTASISLAIITIAPLLALLLTGFPVMWEYPTLRGFNFNGGLVLIPELIALLLALSIYTAAFIAEIVRAGILAVSHGQTEAAYTLGLRPGQTLRLVVIPQALRVIIPPLTNQYLNLVKNSSLAAAIAYPDLVSIFAGTVLNQTGQAIEVIAITMGVYLTISLIISLIMNWYNRRIALVER
ncbi:MAG: amino acid ABC transporter permease [Gammaproteobacteria bacterium]|nr:amino acid ABC transporter permease [Gammaproteobacteria bacterium]